MRIVLDNAILVRGHGGANGLARGLLITIVESEPVSLLSNEMIHELARVLRYPRMLALHGLSEQRICDYLGFLRQAAEIVVLNPLLIAPIRDVNDTVVLQTAVIGDADTLCTRDRDFFEPPAQGFLQKAGNAVLNDIALMSRLRSQTFC